LSQSGHGTATKTLAIATVVELEPGRRVTWKGTALPGLYARHTEALGENRSRFTSWEKAYGFFGSNILIS
jgi:hypothetical protein